MAKHKRRSHKKAKKTPALGILPIVLGLLLILSIVTGGFGSKCSAGELSADEASSKAVNFINQNMLQGRQEVVLNNVKDNGQFYEINIEIGSQKYISYVTKDGRLFFPSAIDLTKRTEPPQYQPSLPQNVAKTGKPKENDEGLSK